MSLPLSARHPQEPAAAFVPMPPLTPAAEEALREIGRAVEPLFHAEEPGVCRDAKSLFRRVAPNVTTNQQLLNAVPRLVQSLLESLNRLGPKYEIPRGAIATAWAEVVNASKD